jgi:hypothetical protein
MFTSDIKAKRYFPDDPWEKYNKMSFLRHKYSLLKNQKLIEENGNKVWQFDRYRAHLDIVGPMNKMAKEQYMPPGYLKTVKDTGGNDLHI